ncbi:enoyl-CoA hydratase/isomerase family protein [Cupriavidus cauae]|uniref:enoyl-CoA hydratase-related protein n=1 Tax=Cupriavidus TaxID=106589 RepID=UPI001CF273F9|nr:MULTISPECIES: enoyl-CoA hydratase-related protein [Cupriavidus]MCA7085981.1 enoyl-CoA hydratase/isomerase family protein [Cupriavidus sp. DB3]UZN50711.1 enoyl-CoA hydratase/isomerase family protein [Cupriavidus cauae]
MRPSNALPDTLVRQDIGEGVLTLSLNDPGTGNAMSVAMAEALAEALEAANRLPDVHCVLLRSTGEYFCTGGNVKDMESGSDLMQGSATQVRARLKATLHRITHALQALQVPSIAAVNGAAIGAGCDLALMCDLRVASERATFAESFLRLGLVSGIGGAWFLTRLVGTAKALELTLTSEFVDAPTALQLGMVSRVVSPEALDEVSTTMARRIASSPPQALRMAKRLVLDAAETTLPVALETAAAMQAILLCGDEHKAAVRDFLGRRARRHLYPQSR